MTYADVFHGWPACCHFMHTNMAQYIYVVVKAKKMIHARYNRRQQLGATFLQSRLGDLNTECQQNKYEDS
jgi:hypothetical protein